VASRGFSGKLADPAVRHERAVKAARARTTVDAHIKALVDAAPPLTDAQKQRLRALLADGGDAHA
jgi:hypothetical protein